MRGGFQGTRGWRLVLAMAAFCALFAVAPQQAGATLLGLKSSSFPDVFSDSVYVKYDPATKLLSAAGYTETFNGVSFSDYYDFSLEATIEANGKVDSGSFRIYRDDDPSSQLLAGDLLRFGFASGDPTLDFLFNITVNNLSPQFSSLAYVTLLDTGYQDTLGTGLSAFENTNPDGSTGGLSDVRAAAVPEPSTVSLLLSGFVALLAYGMRKRQTT